MVLLRRFELGQSPNFPENGAWPVWGVAPSALAERCRQHAEVYSSQRLRLAKGLATRLINSSQARRSPPPTWLWWSKPFWDPILVGRFPMVPRGLQQMEVTQNGCTSILEPILVGIGMFAGGTGHMEAPTPRVPRMLDLVSRLFFRESN